MMYTAVSRDLEIVHARTKTVLVWVLSLTFTDAFLSR
jgi:hypothetical protein